MNDIYGVLSGIMERGRDEHPGDYRGSDGLLRCGVCHQPKESLIISGLLAGRYAPVPCECRKQEREHEERKQKQEQIEKLRAFCLPREQMQSCCFAAAEDSTPIRTAKKYVAHWNEMRRAGTGVVFWGNTGTGKSFSALCIANALIDTETAVLYRSAVDIVSDLMDVEKRQEVFSSIAKAPLLILDDIGAERQTEFAREQLCRVVDARIESGKPLICTTNYSLDEMKTSPDSSQARIFDRVLSVCVPVKVVGESRRKALASGRMEEMKRILAEQ